MNINVNKYLLTLICNMKVSAISIFFTLSFTDSLTFIDLTTVMHNGINNNAKISA